MTHQHDNHAHAIPGTAAEHRTRLSVALGITLVILVAEVVGAILTGSLALLVDAGHMLVDASGLCLALIAAALGMRPSTPGKTWGYRRAEVIAAAAQAALLLAVGIFVIIESIQRLCEPPAIPGTALLLFGIIGLVGNGASMATLSHHREETLNLRAAFLEVMNDALGSVAVIVAAIVITVTGWTGADSVAALLIGALILPRSFRLLRESLSVLLESTPPGLDLTAVREHILALPEVLEVHDLHASRISTDLPILSAHVIVTAESFRNNTLPSLLATLQECVATHFPISVEHSTFQLEPPTHQNGEHSHHE